MAVEFFLKDTPIEAAEAVRLLQVTSGAIKKPIRIELTRLIGAKNLNYKKLIDLAIQNNNRELIEVAWKLVSSSDTDSKSFDKTNNSGIAYEGGPAYQKAVEQPHTPDNLIATLIGYTGSWAGGAALLMRSTVDEWKSIKQIATEYINEREFKPNSKMLSGFDYDETEDVYRPRAGNTSKDKNSFHASRIYMSLREGLMWCKIHGLVEQKEEISYGSNNSETTKEASHMQRVFFKIQTTEKGREVIEQWGDIQKFIDRIYDQY